MDPGSINHPGSWSAGRDVGRDEVNGGELLHSVSLWGAPFDHVKEKNMVTASLEGRDCDHF